MYHADSAENSVFAGYAGTDPVCQFLRIPAYGVIRVLRNRRYGFHHFGYILFFAVNRTNGIIVLIFAFLISPFGLPMLAAWLLGKVQQLRYALQDWLY